MNNPIAKKIGKIVEMSARDSRPGPSIAAAEGAMPRAAKNADAPLGKTTPARVPRGPFKTLTIPDSWYNSLHADAGTGDGTNEEHE